MNSIYRSVLHRTPLFSFVFSGLVGATVLAATFLAPCPALAAGSATRGTVRGLAKEGVEAYTEGDYATASKKLESVYATVQIPTFALWSARALEKQGQLVEASERYLEATRLGDGDGERAAQERARVTAAEEREALLPRVPQLIVQVTPENTDGLTVSINGDEYAVSLLGAKRPTNPGTVTIIAERDGARSEETITLSEGDLREVSLELESEGAVGAPRAARSSSDDDSPRDDAEGAGALRPTLIYGGFSLAALGAGTGIATGLMALTEAKAVKTDYGCDSEGICDEGGEDAQKKANMLGTISTVGFGVGALGVVLGVWGLLLDKPQEQDDPQKGVSLRRPGLQVTLDVGTNNSVFLGGSF